MHLSLQWRLGLAGFSTALILAGVRVPAAAANASVLALNGPNPYNGPCPATLSFNGAISGPGGSTVTYIWARFVNGAPIDSAPATITLPGSSSVTLSVPLPPQALSIDKSTAGFQSYALYITSPTNADNSKGKVFFTVNCVSGARYATNARLALNQPVKLRLHSQWWAYREYEYKWVGATTYVPERGAAPCPDLCIGWDHIKNGDSFFLYHWNTYDRAFLGFAPSALKGVNINKATLTLNVTGGDQSCYGGLGRSIVDPSALNLAGRQTFSAPYPVDGDFTMSVPSQIGAKSTFDVTSIVQGWANGSLPNDGFVLRGKVEDNGSDGNDGCSLDFGINGDLWINQ